MTNQKKKVLLIEDDTFLSHMYELKFTAEGFDVTIANDGLEGLAMVKKKMPDIILLDIILPKMDGWDFLKTLRADLKEATPPVILLTNLGQSNDVKKGMSMGVVDYLIKAHFTPNEVVQRIKQVFKQQ